ncbi:MAG: hypothetical protein JWQ07_91 [Ramlibacter sp.]|nr:hypothetical protein [Ramlibacter sp.]
MTRSHLIARCLTSLILAVWIQCVHAQESAAPSLSIGAVRDRVEGAAVRVLAKYGETLSIADKLVPGQVTGDRGTFFTLNRQVLIDAADKGKFGGLLLRYGVKYYNIGLKTDPNAPPTDTGRPVVKFDGDKWMHVFPVQLGFEADRSFKNKDVLIEAGYIPGLFRSGDSCFKLGANPIIGLSAQLGHKQRSPEPTATGEPAEPSGGLRRVKAEGKMDFALSCVFRTPANVEAGSTDPIGLIFSDIGQWRIVLASTGWRDFAENRTYKKHEVTLRIPTGAKSFMDLKREIGAAPTNFDTGAKFSANLTVEF